MTSENVTEKLNEDDYYFKKNSNNSFKEFIVYIEIIVCAFVLAFVINKYIIINANIPSGSMETTIMTGDKLIGNRLAYLFSEPQRGDIIIFPFPDNNEETYVKRIIGMPGETIEIKDSVVYIDGVRLDEDYLPYIPVIDNFEETVIPADCYFVMGDNRESSIDSRFWVNKFVEKDSIIAKASFIYSPGFRILH